MTDMFQDQEAMAALATLIRKGYTLEDVLRGLTRVQSRHLAESAGREAGNARPMALNTPSGPPHVEGVKRPKGVA